MSFCCGASMVGCIGTLRHEGTYISNVPLLFCPVCHNLEVHASVESEYDILADYAVSDRAQEVDFREFVDSKRLQGIFENCVSLLNEDPRVVFENQINMALDLLLVAKQLGDREWEETLMKRLRSLSEKKSELHYSNQEGNR